MFLTTIQWMPFSLAYLHAYLDEAATSVDLRLAAAFFTLQALTSGHGDRVSGVRRRPLCRLSPRRWARPLAIGKRVRDLGVAGALLLAPIVPMAVVYVRVQGEMGLKRIARRLGRHHGRPASWHRRPTCTRSCCPDCSPARKSTRRRTPTCSLATSLCCSQGRRSSPGRDPARRSGNRASASTRCSCCPASGLPWDRRSGSGRSSTGCRGSTSSASPSRFMLPAMLGLSVLGGLGFDWLTRRLREPARLVAATAVGALLVAEFAVPLTITPYAVVTPPADRWLATAGDAVHRRRGAAAAAVARVRIREAAGRVHAALDGALAEDRPRVERSAAAGASRLIRSAHALSRRRQPACRSRSSTWTTWSCTPDLYPPGEWERVERRLASYQGRLELRHDDGAGRVYALTTPHARLDTPLIERPQLP